MKDERGSLLLVGMDLVGLALSAKNAGYSVYAADYFGDVDLGRSCDGYLSVIDQKVGESAGRIEEDFDPNDFVEMAQVLSEKEEMDGALLSSGLDDSFDVLEKLDKLVGIIGNPPETIRRVRDKGSFFGELKRLGIPYPHTTLVEDFEEAKTAAKNTGYPLMLKPTMGFGGFGVRKVEDHSQLERIFHEMEATADGVLVQEFIEGAHASVSFVASGKGAKTLSVNEQLLGLSEVHQGEPFGYCGNIVPLDIPDPTLNRCEAIVQKVSASFNLTGSNGIDMVISEGGIPHVIEVNPRFQGSLECVERATEDSIVQLHVAACTRGSLPLKFGEPSGHSTRLILYAPGRVVAPDLTGWEGVRDVPVPSSIFEEGEPLCSVYSTGENRDTSLEKARAMAESIYGSIRPSGR